MKFGSSEWMFMAEAEGADDLINTKEAKVNAVIKDMKYNGYTLEAALLNHDLYGKVTSTDIAYIKSEV